MYHNEKTLPKANGQTDHLNLIFFLDCIAAVKSAVTNNAGTITILLLTGRSLTSNNNIMGIKPIIL